jgi:hypothetical protein
MSYVHPRHINSIDNEELMSILRWFFAGVRGSDNSFVTGAEQPEIWKNLGMRCAIGALLLVCRGFKAAQGHFGVTKIKGNFGLLCTPNSASLLSDKNKQLLQALLFNLVLLAALGGLTLYVWNALVPVFLGGPPVNFVQALGVLILVRLLREALLALQAKQKPRPHEDEAWRKKLREQSGRGK